MKLMLLSDVTGRELGCVSTTACRARDFTAGDTSLVPGTEACEGSTQGPSTQHLTFLQEAGLGVCSVQSRMSHHRTALIAQAFLPWRRCALYSNLFLSGMCCFLPSKTCLQTHSCALSHPAACPSSLPHAGTRGGQRTHTDTKLCTVLTQDACLILCLSYSEHELS